METIKIDFGKKTGTIKPMNCVNNGPEIAGCEQVRSNVEEFKRAKFPVVRNHDASFCSSFGGEHTVDVHAIFPNFDADEESPDSYDFAYTDLYTKHIIDTGSQVYYRLGSKIEHGIKKYGTVAPKDPYKWARICEHIIRHYNEGWADGFYFNIKYWEIWNEPNGIAADGNMPNWGGTTEQFYELFYVTVKHLKECFTDIYIGGPAFCSFDEKWMRDFFEYLRKDGMQMPLDFIGYHWYGADTPGMTARTLKYRKILDEYGYTETKMYLDEWNYCLGWGDRFAESIKDIISMRGAAFNAAVMSTAQKDPVDMIMYYDARPNTVFNGLFDFYTLKPLKGYYPFLMFSQLKELKTEVYSYSSNEDIYVTAAADGDRHAAMISYYSYDKGAYEKRIKVDISGVKNENWRYYILDSNYNMQEFILPESGELSVEASTVILITDYCINE